MTDDWGFSSGSGFQPGPVSSSNIADGFSQVGVQAGVVHGDVNQYTVAPNASPEEKFEVGVRHLDGRMADQARQLMREFVVSSAKSDRVRFHWLLALVSGRSRNELSADESRQLRDLQEDQPEQGDDPWAQSLRAVLLLLEATEGRNTDVTVALKELDALPDPQKGMILRHTEQFLEGPLEDEVWQRAIVQARNEQKINARTDRVKKFFHPDPVAPRTRPPHPVDISKQTRLRAVVSAVFLAAWSVHVAVRLTAAGKAWTMLGCTLVLTIGALAVRHGATWKIEYIDTADEAGSLQPSGAFAKKIDHDLKNRVATNPPSGIAPAEWLQWTARTRRSIANEIINLYWERWIGADRVAWLLQHEAWQMQRMWRGGTNLSYTRAQRAVPGLGAYGLVGIAVLAGGGLWTLVATAGVEVLLALETAIFVTAAAYIHVLARLEKECEKRRFAAEHDQYEKVRASREAGFERWKAYLADRPDDQEMARWLDCDRRIILDRALHHYRLTASNVIAHAFIETQAASSKRGRVHRGPLRYKKYQISVFLLTADGVRNFVSVLDFDTGDFSDKGRLNYRFDSVAFIRVNRDARNVQKVEIVLVNGQILPIQMTETAPEEITADETTELVADLTQDASGLQHTIHVLEGIAAEGRRWFRRTASGW
ncbi:conserved membrane hypothetical protein [Parafrankia sp. Ea1.12]|uniref:hypothetical protein n=1 Tax=Parafrankia sp. Ea1.12 TaxID=573499 RepID=UPI000DA43FA6|nr:hypothetical protein [Parafrankia sp. Ea1.12]SQD95012.1 conserved membrane hypothetical protein [Parafrankia sp. Ea1.12]